MKVTRAARKFRLPETPRAAECAGMPLVCHHSILNGVRGTIAGVTYRSYADGNGRTRVVASLPPQFPGEWSEAQKLHRQRFGIASRYADLVQADPVRLAHYKAAGRRKGTTWRAMAIRDWFRDQKERARAKAASGAISAVRTG